nr:MAG TPA: upper collar protein [Caudoviricetes sp.]
MGRRRKTNFEESLFANMRTYGQYMAILKQIAISMFDWKNLPDSVDERYLEIALFYNGAGVYFNDEVMGNLALNMIFNGEFSVYGEPVSRRAFSRYNQYQKILDKNDSVIIWNNLDRTPTFPIIDMFARRLYNIDRAIDVNVNAQKTPTLIRCDEKQRLTLVNAYKEMDGNSPVIYADKSFDPSSITTLKTNAPYVADKLYELKSNLWNEALTYLGIPNANVMKRERLIKDEVLRSLGGTMANRYSRLQARQEAVEKINRMFGTNIEVGIKEEIEDMGNVDLNVSRETFKGGDE